MANVVCIDMCHSCTAAKWNYKHYYKYKEALIYILVKASLFCQNIASGLSINENLALIFSDRKLQHTDTLTWILMLPSVNLMYMHQPKLGERTLLLMLQCCTAASMSTIKRLILCLSYTSPVQHHSYHHHNTQPELPAGPQCPCHHRAKVRSSTPAPASPGGIQEPPLPFSKLQTFSTEDQKP